MDSIEIITQATRGLVQAMEAKGYAAPRVSFSIKSSERPYAVCYATEHHFVVGRGDTLEELVADALEKIATEIRPAVDPRLANWFGPIVTDAPVAEAAE